MDLTYNQNKLYNISDCLFRDMFNFDFLWKGMRLSPPPHFLHDFQEIYFSCCSLLTDQISCLIAFTWDIVPILWRHKFETTLAFLSSCFPIWPKMAGEKFKTQDLLGAFIYYFCGPQCSWNESNIGVVSQVSYQLRYVIWYSSQVLQVAVLRPGNEFFIAFSLQGLSVNFYRFSFISILVAVQIAPCKTL